MLLFVCVIFLVLLVHIIMYVVELPLELVVGG